jgi:hypothetical protein
MRRDLHKRVVVFAIALAIALTTAQPLVCAQTPDDGGVTYDSAGGEILQSLFIPIMANAPFSLTVAAEWSRSMTNGGTYTTVNSRPIKRDSAGRIYQERWLMSPKGSKIPPRMSWIQIADPVAHTFYECEPHQKVCELRTLRDSVTLRFNPARVPTGPVKDATGEIKGTRTHEDLGAGSFAGMLIHEYRDTTTLNAGVMGNDLPMSTVRQYRFSAELGLNLSSILEAPQIGRQIFTVTEINTTEPDPAFFQPPQGYKILDHRASAGVQ